MRILFKIKKSENINFVIHQITYNVYSSGVVLIDKSVVMMIRGDGANVANEYYYPRESTSKNYRTFYKLVSAHIKYRKLLDKFNKDGRKI